MGKSKELYTSRATAMAMAMAICIADSNNTRQ